jgi:hypothetical protein
MRRQTARALKVVVPALALPAAAQLAATRPWLYGGATYEEMHRRLPGDELLGAAALQATRAITVGVSADEVWPWVARLGVGSGGWYTSAGFAEEMDRVCSDDAQLDVGDVVVDPSGRTGLRVVRSEAPWELVLTGSLRPPGAGPLDLTWAFVLVPRSGDRTRLVVRIRYGGPNRVRTPAFAHGLELVDAVFTWRMLRGLANRAERAGWRPPADAEAEGTPAGVGSAR